MMKYIFILLMFCGLQSQSQVYVGVLGEYPIVLKIEPIEENEIIVHYFYVSKLLDISIQGEKRKNIINFTFKSANNNNEFETFNLVLTNNVLSGTWKNQKNKLLPVKLALATPAKFSSIYDHLPYVQNLKFADLYNYIRVSFMKFERDSVQAFEGKNFVWFNEKFSQMRHFRLGNGFSLEQRQTINPQLDEYHIKFAVIKCTCSSFYTYSSKSDVNYYVELTFLNNHLLGWSNFMYYDCGGIHPDFGGSGYVIDLDTYEEKTLNELITFDPDNKIIKNETDPNYRENFLAPGILNLLKDKIKQIADSDSQPECKYDDESVWTYSSWVLTKDGFLFTPKFPRINRACEEDFQIDMEALKPYMTNYFKNRL